MPVLLRRVNWRAFAFANHPVLRARFGWCRSPISIIRRVAEPIRAQLAAWVCCIFAAPSGAAQRPASNSCVDGGRCTICAGKTRHWDGLQVALAAARNRSKRQLLVCAKPNQRREKTCKPPTRTCSRPKRGNSSPLRPSSEMCQLWRKSGPTAIPTTCEH